MDKLQDQDLRDFIRALDVLHADAGKVELSERIVKAAADLIAADRISFNVFSLDGKYQMASWRKADYVFTPERLELIEKYIHESPIFVECVLKRSPKVLKLSDFMTVKEFRRTNIYQAIYKAVGADYQMAVMLPVSKDFTLTLFCSRQDRDFTERDRLILQFLVPHLTNAVTNGLAFERLTDLLETDVRGMILIPPGGGPPILSRFASELVGRYFGGVEGDTSALPAELVGWLGGQKMPQNGDRTCRLPRPLTIENKHGKLSVWLTFDTLTGERTLLLKEKQALTPQTLERLSLTKREAEILYWISKGKSDAEIGSLCEISPRTVSKHAEHIYLKLGVENRHAAMRRALEIAAGLIGAFSISLEHLSGHTWGI